MVLTRPFLDLLPFHGCPFQASCHFVVDQGPVSSSPIVYLTGQSYCSSSRPSTPNTQPTNFSTLVHFCLEDGDSKFLWNDGKTFTKLHSAITPYDPVPPSPAPAIQSPISPEQTEDFSHLANMEKCCEGKSLQFALPISNVGMFYLWQAITVVHSLHINSNKLRQCCQGDMTAKGGYVSRVGGSSSEEDMNMKQKQWTKPLF